MRSRDILVAVAAKHNLQVSDIVGRSHVARVIDARREAVRLMKEAGVPLHWIASACQRNRTTVMYYLNPEMPSRKKAYYEKRRDDARGAA